MESLAYIHGAVAYESDEPIPELRQLNPSSWQIPSSAWISMQSLVVVTLVLSVTTSVLAASTATVNTNTGGPLNVRNAPAGEIVGTVPNGSTIELTGRESNGWLERTDGTWISQQFVSGATATPQASVSSTASPQAQATTTVQPIPSTQSAGAAQSPSTQSSTAVQPSTAPKPVASTAAQPSPTAQPAAATAAQSSPQTQPTTAAEPAPAPQSPVAAQPASAPATTAQSSTPQTRTSAATTVATINTGGTPLNVRSNPGGSTVGTLPNGTRVELTGREQGGWVERTNGTWVSKQYLVYSQTASNPSPTPTQSSVGSSASTAFVRTSGTPLNVRSSPGGAIVGSLPNGTRVELSGRRNGQWAERSNGTWVAANYLSTSGGSTTPPPNQGGDASVAYVRTNGTPLNVRSSPNGPIVGSIANGSRVELSGRRNGQWAERSNGTWVSANYLSTSGGGTTPPDQGGDASVAYIRTNGTPLNVRSSPNGPVVGTIANGSRVELSGRRSGEWVQLSNGNWVAGSWISTSGGGTAPPGQGGDASVAYIRTNGTPLNVRSSPNGPVVGTIANGSRVELSGRRSGEWVQLSNGNWVSGAWVSP